MNGPEHYKAAENLLKLAWDDAIYGADTVAAIAAAQVHATLAHTAAVALATSCGAYAAETTAGDKWREVLLP